MAVFNDRIKSFVNGLSDFWLIYFQEIDQLEVFYRGTEILIGQTYLDLMSLLVNNSLQDTTIFNKEFFKLLQIKETDIEFRAGTTTENDRYVLVLLDDIVFARHLNNKILTATMGLDKDVDYYINDETRSLEFLYDPTNAYYELTLGSLGSQMRLRSKLITGSNIRVHLNDTGGALAISRTDFDVTIVYDGPASTGTTSTNDIVQALNLDVQTNGLLLSEVTGLGTGTGSPPGNGGLTPLARVAVNSLDGFATRRLEVAFASQLSSSTVTNWVAEGVEKGDILRLIEGISVGTATEIEINLVRPDALFQDTGGEATLPAGDKIDFVVLREPEGATATQESFVDSGAVTQTGIDGTITAATRELFSPTALFETVYEGDVIEIIGISNLGDFRILSVVDANTVVLAFPGALDETPVRWNLRTVVDPSSINTDSALTNNGDTTATFTAASATFVATDVNTVVKIERGGVIEAYTITAFTSGTEVTLSVDDTVVDGVGLSWGLANVATPSQLVVFSPPVGWIKPGTVTANARRLVDNQAVLQDRDYTVTVDTGIITPTTIWRTSSSNTVTYDYRIAIVENTVSLQNGADGTVTSGSPNVFTAPTAVFGAEHIGHAIKVSGSGLVGATNNGLHFIAAVTSPTTVELTGDKIVSTTADPSNGILVWELLRRGVFTTDSVTEFVAESAFWVPDALVDRFHLYNTYGYLINRFERSSEAYRSLIRGIFQLFMLGPTLERFESAVNTVAGLDVIRDDGEILLSYNSGALQSGVDGFFDFATKTFTAASAVFAGSAAADFIFAVDGANVRKLFKIVAVTNATTVVLAEAPTTEGPVSWEHSETPEHSVTTSHRTYTFGRQIPIRDRVRDPANIGLIIFQAFEVLTDVFQVTDYIEDPTWFDFKQIPVGLLPNQSDSRRQSTPILFENIISPGDEGQIGDPGFIIGADSEGFIAPTVLQRDDAGAADGVITGDPSYPFSNMVTFTSSTGAFTSADIGNSLVVDPGGPTEATFRILLNVSATVVELEAFVDVDDASGLSWQVVSSPLAKRHKMAFVVLNRYLKYHLFSVDFDISLLGQVSSSLVTDLQELVFAAKPAYTFVLVSPSALFQDILTLTEVFTLEPTLALGGEAGTIIAVNENPLNVIGSSWRIGTWFRYAENTSTFAAPAASIALPLGAPTAGYLHHVNKIYVTPTDFTSGGDPIQVGAPQLGATFRVDGLTDLSVTVVSGVVTATITSAPFLDTDLGGEIHISGSGLGNNGAHRIGALHNPSTAILDSPSFVAEAGLDWQIHNTGGIQGNVIVQSGGLVDFEDATGGHPFDVAHVGDYVRRTFVTHVSNQSFLIDEFVSTTRVKLATQNRVDPIEGDPDLTGSVAGGVLTVVPGDVIFSPLMTVVGRAKLIPTTKDVAQFFINFTSGPDSGTSFPVFDYVAPNKVQLVGATDAASADYNVTVKRAPAAVNETSNWERFREQIVIADTTIDLSNTPTQDVNGAVGFTAYGVREPIDPVAEIFDDTAGDTLYSIGMPNPRQKRGKSRTGKDTDMREEPIEITRT